MTVLELIEILKQKFKENGNVDVKLWDCNENKFCDFSVEHSTDIVDISNRGDINQFVPVPLLKIEKEE